MVLPGELAHPTPPKQNGTTIGDSDQRALGTSGVALDNLHTLLPTSILVEAIFNA